MYRRIVFLGLIQFISDSSRIRAGCGFLIAAASCVSFRESLPYQDTSANMLALAARWQIVLTYLGAYLLESDLLLELLLDRRVLGAILLGANVVILPLMTMLSYKRMHKQALRDESIAKLKEQLLTDKDVDRNQVRCVIIEPSPPEAVICIWLSPPRCARFRLLITECTQ